MTDRPGGVADWARAALELRRSRRAALRVPLQGSASRVSTTQVAGQSSVRCTTLDPVESVKVTGGRGRGRLFSTTEVGGNCQMTGLLKV
ncbi:hypothetical protein NDU88_006021 [Pleurodeles waltl]|uniref:Uncharacterized protein n=1 Tax=Pleurodeles waltl TaxID=8319 RepID=A0AAV7MXZ8_PLEWA|nr:hypothetical protein NDU88_006021 [Pleurodeles waltl]